MRATTPQVRGPDGPLIVVWVLAEAACTVLATLLAEAIANAGWDAGLNGWLLLSTNLVFYFVQWAILRAYLPGLRWPSWVGPSTLALLGSSLLLGVLDSVLVAQFADNPYPPLIVAGLLGGATIGYAQSLVLGRYVQRSDWWIVAYAIGQAAQHITAQALAGVWGDTHAFLPTLFEAAPIGAVLGVVTVVALGGMLRNPLPTADLAALLQRQAARPSQVRRRAYLGTGLLLVVSLACVVLGLAFLNPSRATPVSGAVPPPTLRPEDIPAGWRVFISDAGRFRVVFPSVPTESIQDVNAAGAPLLLHSAVAAGGEAQYVVLYSDNGTDIPASRVNALLDSVSAGAVDSAHGQLRDELPITVQGYPAQDVHLQMGDGRFLHMWAVIAGRRIYQVGVFTPYPGSAAQDVEKFFQSFQVLGP